jgi:hypothetical protein
MTKLVYFAGKVDSYRSKLLGKSVMSNPTGRLCPIASVPGAFVRYGGPNALSCDHGCWHGEAHGLVDCSKLGFFFDEHQFFLQADSEPLDSTRCPGTDDYLGFSPNQAVLRCLNQIEKADAVHAYIDSEDAVGTFVELGWAAAKGKPIYLVIKPKLRPSESGWPEFWFASHLPTVKSVDYGGPTTIHLDLLEA